MASQAFMYMAVLAVANTGALADGPFQFCPDDKCEDCPVQLTDAGTGFPNCVIYSTEDVFGGQPAFNGSASGGYTPFMNVPKPDERCKIIVRSPADPGVLECGKPVAGFSKEVCATLNLDTTFMVQFCCGTGDCKAAGVSKRSAKFGSAFLGERGSGGGGGAAYLVDASGNKIEPIYDGPPMVKPSYQRDGEEPREVRTPDKRSVEKKAPLGVRDSTCDVTSAGSCPSSAPVKRDPSKTVFGRSCTPDSNSWVPADTDYLRPADSSTVVSPSVDGSDNQGQVSVSTTRSQTWTTSESANIGLSFEDVLNIGVSFSQEYSCEISQSDTVTENILPGQVGKLAFTAYLDC